MPQEIQTSCKTVLPLITAVLIATCPARAADDEARLKSKQYTPGKKLNESSFSGKKYSASDAKRLNAANYDKPAQESKGWLFFKSKAADKGQPAKGDQLSESKPYKQEKHTVVPTIKADARAIEEKKPFVKSDQELPASIFKPTEKSDWHNPLLKPRQGVKEFVE